MWRFGRTGDCNEVAVRSAAEGLAANGHKVLAVKCDVADDAQVEAMVEQAVAAFGRLDAARFACSSEEYSSI
jgi:NAD(P)-dependent dehydrogenase (short-subunit alcohol dehydrogenase family)